MHARVARHNTFLAARTWPAGATKYTNENHGFAVVTRQEQEIRLEELSAVCSLGEHRFKVEYRPFGSQS
jgi:hypothetical protein